MSYKSFVFVAVLLTIPLVSCSKYSTRDYLDLEEKYHNLQMEYDSLKTDYENLNDEYSDYMTYWDVQELSDFANNNTFGYKGFYSTAYSVVLKTGGKTTIRIGYDGYNGIAYESNNNYATAEWGDWDADNRAALTIEGNSQGITYFTFTNEDDSREFKVVVFVID